LIHPIIRISRLSTIVAKGSFELQRYVRTILSVK